MDQDFREIAHSGGKITFRIKTDEQGRQSYQIGVASSRPGPMSMIAVYAIAQGVPVASINLGGIGQDWNPPPFPGCYPVMIQSDSHGKFGHHCPQCDGYWRSGPWPNLCPYCNAHGEGYQFLSKAQRDFIVHYCDVLTNAIADIENGEVVIDMDEVADAAELKPEERPSFYVSEESQQHKFKCSACEEFNDILGRFGYCSLCGTRNDLMEFEEVTVKAIREPVRLGELLRAIKGYKGGPIVRAALQLAPILFQRPGELRGATWAEMDLEAALWTIPAARMKRGKDGKENGQPHLVPLPTQAVRILEVLKPYTESTGLVFPGERQRSKPISENSVRTALIAMGYTADIQTWHGFRATARTMLAEVLEFEPLVIEAQLAHSVRDANGRAYNRTTYLKQRQEMMQRWADYLDKLAVGADVVELKRA